MRRYSLIFLALVVSVGLVPGLSGAKLQIPPDPPDPTLPNALLIATPNPCGSKCGPVLSMAQRKSHVTVNPSWNDWIDPMCYENSGGSCSSGGSGSSSDECWSSQQSSGRRREVHYGDPVGETLYEFDYHMLHCPDGSWRVVIMAWIGQSESGQTDDFYGFLTTSKGNKIKFDWPNTCCRKPTRDGMYYLGEMYTPVMSIEKYGNSMNFYLDAQTVWPPSTGEGSTNIDNWEWGPWGVC